MTDNRLCFQSPPEVKLYMFYINKTLNLHIPNKLADSALHLRRLIRVIPDKGLLTWLSHFAESMVPASPRLSYRCEYGLRKLQGKILDFYQYALQRPEFGMECAEFSDHRWPFLSRANCTIQSFMVLIQYSGHWYIKLNSSALISHFITNNNQDHTAIY